MNRSHIGTQRRIAGTVEAVRAELDTFETEIAAISPEGPLLVAMKLDLAHVLVVGGGAVATQRARSLLYAGAQVRVVAPRVSPELRRRIAWGEIAWSQRRFEDNDLDHMQLVMVAIDDRDESRRVASAARSRCIAVNVADVPTLCDFYMPASHREGPVQVAVSTGGVGPAIAARVRDLVTAALPPELAEATRRFGQLRKIVRELEPSRTRRMELLARIGRKTPWSELACLESRSSLGADEAPAAADQEHREASG